MFGPIGQVLHLSPSEKQAGYFKEAKQNQPVGFKSSGNEDSLPHWPHEGGKRGSSEHRPKLSLTCCKTPHVHGTRNIPVPDANDGRPMNTQHR